MNENSYTSRSNIIVSGTGRCGTTFLMLIFTFLGMETGFDETNYQSCIDNDANAGLEKNTDYAYIVKSPAYIQCITELILESNIDWMIIPIREYEDSALSRYKLGPGVRGGLWESKNAVEQVQMYWRIMAKYMRAMVKYQIPTIFLDFDRMIVSQKYLYNKLLPIFETKNISFDKFKVAYTKATLHQRRKSSLFKIIDEYPRAIDIKKDEIFNEVVEVADDLINKIECSPVAESSIMDQAIEIVKMDPDKPVTEKEKYLPDKI